jgi:hypothetical protein
MLVTCVSMTPTTNFSPASLTLVKNKQSAISLFSFEKSQIDENRKIWERGDIDETKKPLLKNLVPTNLYATIQ